MKASHILIAFLMLVIMLLGCTGGGSSDMESVRVTQPSDTLYTLDAATEIFASDLDRALLIIDSAEIVGNLSDIKADILRAKVYACTSEEMNYDTAILIGERLMHREEVIENLGRPVRVACCCFMDILRQGGYNGTP